MALVVSHDGARWLPSVIGGLQGQRTGPARVVAIITRDAARELGLEPGMSAAAVVKATSVMVERGG